MSADIQIYRLYAPELPPPAMPSLASAKCKHMPGSRSATDFGRLWSTRIGCRPSPEYELPRHRDLARSYPLQLSVPSTRLWALGSTSTTLCHVCPAGTTHNSWGSNSRTWPRSKLASSVPSWKRRKFTRNVVGSRKPTPLPANANLRRASSTLIQRK
jgi:hypothetical protein